MCVKVILFTSLFILGYAFILDELLLDKGCGGDIAFIIDSSDSIYTPNFYKGMNFMQRLIERLRTGPNHVNIAAVAFGEVVLTNSAFGFNKFNTHSDILQALKNIKHPSAKGKETNTHLAIDYARKRFFVHARPYVKKIAIILTDGKSTYFTKTKAEAELLKSLGVTIFAIGVGPNLMRELYHIASQRLYVFSVDDTYALSHIIQRLRPIICTKCEDKPIDIAFIIDSSISITQENFDKGIDFLQTFIEMFSIGPNHVRIAAVAFGDIAIRDSAFGFNEANTTVNAHQAIKNIIYQTKLGHTTQTDKGIMYARETFFVHARPNVKKIAFVITDGQSTYPTRTKAEAELLKSQGVEIAVIGVGDQVTDEELNAIASRYQNVFKVKSYHYLEDIIDRLGLITC